jgi:hypothetical protein
VTILHPEAARDDEREKGHKTEVKSNCTEVCNTNQNTSKSCAKIILVKVFLEGEPSKARDIYCMIDD